MRAHGASIRSRTGSHCARLVKRRVAIATQRDAMHMKFLSDTGAHRAQIFTGATANSVVHDEIPENWRASTIPLHKLAPVCGVSFSCLPEVSEDSLNVSAVSNEMIQNYMLT